MAHVSKAGISPARAWQLAADSVPNLAFRAKVSGVGQQLSGSEKMSDLVFRSNLFPDEYAPMVASAEYTGDLPGAMQKLSDLSAGEFVAAQNQCENSRRLLDASCAVRHLWHPACDVLLSRRKHRERHYQGDGLGAVTLTSVVGCGFAAAVTILCVRHLRANGIREDILVFKGRSFRDWADLAGNILAIGLVVGCYPLAPWAQAAAECPQLLLDPALASKGENAVGANQMVFGGATIPFFGPIFLLSSYPQPAEARRCRRGGVPRRH